MNTTHPIARRHFLETAGGALLLAGTAAACGGGGGQQSGGSSSSSGKNKKYQLDMVLDPGDEPEAIAAGEGFFQRVELNYQRVGYDASSTQFLARKLPVGVFSPTELVEPKNRAAKLVFFSTAGAIDFINGIVIRAQDASKYHSLTDLRGRTVGQPGFGTGTWQTFVSIARSVYNMDPRRDLHLVTADPGALLGLLQKKRIDAAVTFSTQAITAVAEPDKFKLISSFSADWRKKTGQPLVITGLVGRRPWLDQHREIAKDLISGVDQAVAWSKKHPDELLKGGKYESWSNAAGFFTTPKTPDAMIRLIKQGKYFYTSDLYTKEWVDSTYEFIKTSTPKGTKIPAKEDIFYLPLETG